MWRSSDRMSKPPTLNCRRAADGSITAKVRGDEEEEEDEQEEEEEIRKEENG